ncbi:MAG TPA: acyltransferase [Bacteroidia bacterium]|nr:acyltransferase [Bacteroidia bacterium]
MIYNPKRITHLDGLRGVLALVVFVYHFLFCLAPQFILGGTRNEVISDSYTLLKTITYTPLNLFYNGSMAVNFFFVLSAYVLSYNYFNNNKAKLIRKNILKRYFRLAIPVLASCLFIYTLHVFNLFYKTPFPVIDVNRAWLSGLFPDNLDLLQLIKYALVNVFFDDNASYNSVLWTMGIELTGSILVFVSLLATHKLKTKGRVFVAIILVEFAVKKYYSVGFSLGLLICYLQCNNTAFKNIAANNYFKAGLLLCGLYLSSFPFLAYQNGLAYTIYAPIDFLQGHGFHKLAHAFGCSAILIVFINSQKLKIIFSSKPFQFLGKVSFSFYLLHLSLLLVFASRIYQLLYPYFIDTVNLPLTFILSLFCILTVSFLFYRYIDFYAVKYASKISSLVFETNQ